MVGFSGAGGGVAFDREVQKDPSRRFTASQICVQGWSTREAVVVPQSLSKRSGGVCARRMTSPQSW